MSLETSASGSGEKYVNEFMFAGKMCLTDCGVENCAVRFVIALMKNVAKSSAVVEVRNYIYSRCYNSVGFFWFDF